MILRFSFLLILLIFIKLTTKSTQIKKQRMQVSVKNLGIIINSSLRLINSSLRLTDQVNKLIRKGYLYLV